MNKQEIFDAWSPRLTPDEFGPPWIYWAKPVLFAHLDQLPVAAPVLDNGTSMDLSWAPPAADRVALMIDLPGAESVRAGVALAKSGYRPVPLFNACPGPSAVVAMEPIMQALATAAEILKAMTIPPNAPPAFLVDAGRMPVSPDIKPGRFDNRWVVFPQDLPSANLLLARRIQAIGLVRETPGQPPSDLAHVLRRWQDAGLQVWSKGVRDNQPSTVIQVERPSRFRSLYYRLLTTLGLRRNSAGGFGSVIPIPSAGGGFG